MRQDQEEGPLNCNYNILLCTFPPTGNIQKVTGYSEESVKVMRKLPKRGKGERAGKGGGGRGGTSFQKKKIL